ncbi:MAG: PilC/PilY family type IV pilus protein [Thermomonas sp.]|uniref:pilus assembly protein n=1 Tax=Thermomonas sp. TaxID=1971895 RepID=UPI0039E72634
MITVKTGRTGFDAGVVMKNLQMDAGRLGRRRSRKEFLSAVAAGLLAGICSFPVVSGVTIDNKPLGLGSVPGNIVLVPSVEWPTVVTHANEPGKGDAAAPYSGATEYTGYFNPGLCYAYHYDATEANRYFYPVKAAGTGRTCSGTGGVVTQRLWSGNFMNWAAMQAVDTFRLALTGGYRVHRPADGTPAAGTSEMANVTYLEKGNSDRWDNGYTKLRRIAASAGSYAPVQTAGMNTRVGGLRSQMWFMPSADGDLGDSESYANPQAIPLPVTSDQQTTADGDGPALPYNPAFHALPDAATVTVTNTTACATGETGCSYAYTVRGTNYYTHTVYGRDKIYAVSVRVKVCDGSLDTRDICTQYGSYYKPEGLLQWNAKKIRYSLFSYLAQSGVNRNGGVMRARQKFLGPVLAGEKLYPDKARQTGIDNPEWDPSTGVILNNPDSADAASTSERIGTCLLVAAPDGSQCQIQYSGVINYINRFGQINTGFGELKSYDNLSEMFYAALLYLRGSGNVPEFSAFGPLVSSLTRYQYADGFPVIEDWYKTGSNAAASAWSANNLTVGAAGDPIQYKCQATVMLGIGDTHTSYEGDAASLNNDDGVNVAAWRGYTEGTNTDTRMNVAGLAYWAHINDIRPDVPNTDVSDGSAGAKRGQTISTYWVDVVEQQQLYQSTTNQYYNATKYGGYAIPAVDWDANGNAARHDLTWFTNNRSLWSSATQMAGTATGLGDNSASNATGKGGNYYLPNNMFLANNGQAMIEGLTKAFSKITDDISGSGGSFASNSTRLDTGSYAYQAKYMSSGWGGRLIASSVDVSTGELTEQWDAATWLTGSSTTNDYSKRKLLYNSGGTLVNFISNWSNYTVLTSPTVSKPSALSSLTDAQLKYLLGDRSQERQYGGALRNRKGMLGDIINSQPVYVGAPNSGLYKSDSAYASFLTAQASRTPVVYVGANDGMLHAFNANTGTEIFAFMPTAAMAVLKQNDATSNLYPNWSPDYDHAFSMDGEITVADVKDGTTWKTILVATMGRGGKAVFALDVTNPSSPSLLWEKSASDITALGNSLGKPMIAKVADGDWRVFLGNGPNASGGGSTLIALDIKTGANDGSITAGTGADNGLGPVNVWDADNDGNFDTAYAGDMNGDLWKFNITAGTASKIFAAGSTQPITVAPLVAKNPNNSLQTWVFFGTGRFLSLADINAASNANVQTWYGLIDSGTLISGKSALEEISILLEDEKGRIIEENTSLDTSMRGWYMDLKVSGGTNKGERMVVPNFFQGLDLIGTSRYPDSSDPCSPSGKGYTMAINPFTGGRLSKAFFDNDGDGTVGDDGDQSNGTPYSGITYDSGPNNPIFIGNTMYTSLDDGTSKITKTNSAQGLAKRVSWRELINGS